MPPARLVLSLSLLLVGSSLMGPGASARLSAQTSGSDVVHSGGSAVLEGALKAELHVLDALAGGAAEPASFGSQLRGALATGSLRSAGYSGTLRSVAPDVHTVIERTHTLLREVFAIYSGGSGPTADAAADAAVRRYLEIPGSLAGTPRSMDLMHRHQHAGEFGRVHPEASRTLWGNHWARLGLFEPLLLARTPAELEAGMDTVVARYHRKLASGDALPIAMPTPIAIAPELVRRHPQLAAVLDNLHMLADLTADILVAGGDGAAGELTVALSELVGPSDSAITEFDWMLAGLRHGIYNQGGPALGRLAWSERNERRGGHDHGTASGRPSGMGIPATVPSLPESGDGHAGHAGH
jgi:hypothetical protein